MNSNHPISKRPLRQSSLQEAFTTTPCESSSVTVEEPLELYTDNDVAAVGTSCATKSEHTDATGTPEEPYQQQEKETIPVQLQTSSVDTLSDSRMWVGETLASLKTPCSPLPKLCCKAGHRIFFSCTNSGFDSRVPYPSMYTDKWSENFVRMPCSPESLYPLTESGKKSLVVRWTLIEKKLREATTSSRQLQEAILSYNERFKSAWNFNVLHDVIAGSLPDGDVQSFFSSTLPALCAMALNLPVYLTRPIPLMRKGCEMSFTFSQLQIASLLANAFFCTFPRRNSSGRNSEFSRFPSINFSKLLSAPGNKYTDSSRKREKVRCLLHYFQRVTQTMPVGTVTYTRRCLGASAPNWAESTRSFDQLRIHINSEETIEQCGMNAIQVDFANKFLGGGVLRSGCVQEEIMFVLRPELLVACLFVECLNDDEAVLIEGAETYSRSSGYANTFRWMGDYCESQEGMERDEWGRWKTTVVAIDATHFHSFKAQFAPEMIKRELNKAYCGFTDDLAPGRKLPSLVATGNWGCGAFRGNVNLKALLQMMACVQAGKSMAYYTFGDKALMSRLYDMYLFLHRNSVSVGSLWNILTTLDDSILAKPDALYEYIKERIVSSSEH